MSECAPNTYPKPWEQCPHIWSTEAKFWTFVRGVLRKGWSKHPVKIQFIKDNRRRIINPVEKNRARFPTCWGMTCDICKQDTVQSEIEIDHIGEGSSFTGLHDVEKYVAHLFLVDYTSIRPVCKPCHKIENQRQRKGIGFEDAKIEKEVIHIMKSESVPDIIIFIDSYIENADWSNATKRRKLVEGILRSIT